MSDIRLIRKDKTQTAEGPLFFEDEDGWIIRPVLFTSRGDTTFNPRGLTFRKRTWQVRENV